MYNSSAIPLFKAMSAPPYQVSTPSWQPASWRSVTPASYAGAAHGLHFAPSSPHGLATAPSSVGMGLTTVLQPVGPLAAVGGGSGFPQTAFDAAVQAAVARHLSTMSGSGASSGPPLPSAGTSQVGQTVASSSLSALSGPAVPSPGGIPVASSALPSTTTTTSSSGSGQRRSSRFSTGAAVPPSASGGGAAPLAVGSSLSGAAGPSPLVPDQVFLCRRSAMLTLLQIAPSPYLPAGEMAPQWAEYTVVADDVVSRVPFQLHRLSADEWQDLADVQLGSPSDTVASLSALFSRVASATGGTTGSRAPPSDGPSLLAHLRNWLHLWRCMVRNADAQVKQVVELEKLVGAASAAAPSSTVAMPPEFTAHAQVLADGMSQLSAIGLSMQRAASSRTRLADKPLRPLLHARGATGYINDLTPPPPLETLEDVVNACIRGGSLAKEKQFLLANWRHSWDVAWCDSEAATSLDSLDDALAVLIAILFILHGGAVAERLTFFRDYIRAQRSTGWLPAEAYQFTNKALGFWIDDVQTLFSDPVRSTPLVLPTGLEESKEEFQRRALPRVGTPWLVKSADELERLRDAVRERRVLAQLMSSLGKRVATGSPGGRRRDKKKLRTDATPTSGSRLRVDFAAFKAKYAVF